MAMSNVGQYSSAVNYGMMQWRCEISDDAMALLN